MRVHIAFVRAVVALIASTASGYSGEITDAWAWGNDHPLQYTPQYLVDEDWKYDDGNRKPIADEDGLWTVKSTDPYNYDYHYILFYWDYKPAWETIYFRWRVSLAGGAVVQLFRWTGSAWSKIDDNEGGSSPDGVSTNVTSYFNDNVLILIAVGGTSTGEFYSCCDIARLRQNE